MSPPNQHLPGQSVMFTRRTLNGVFYLAPVRGLAQITLYSLGKHVRGQVISALVNEITHYHMHLNDRAGNRSELYRDHNSTVARARNRTLGREGKFWDERRPSDVVLLDEDAILEKLLYVILNPVKDGLVERAHHFPGNLILPRHWKEDLVIARPNVFFDPANNPDFVTVPTGPPAIFQGYDIDEVIHYMEGQITEREEHYSQKRINEAAAGRGRATVLGRRGCWNIDPFDSRDRSDLDIPIRKRVSPRWASKKKGRQKLARLNRQRFLRAHLVNRRKFKAGQSDAIFPAGTIQMRKLAGAHCQPPDLLLFYAAGGWHDPTWTPPNYPRPPT